MDSRAPCNDPKQCLETTESFASSLHKGSTFDQITCYLYNTPNGYWLNKKPALGFTRINIITLQETWHEALQSQESTDQMENGYWHLVVSTLTRQYVWLLTSPEIIQPFQIICLIIYRPILSHLLVPGALYALVWCFMNFNV
jgi:hypothetical protein